VFANKTQLVIMVKLKIVANVLEFAIMVFIIKMELVFSEDVQADLKIMDSVDVSVQQSLLVDASHQLSN
jgi:uncharacterized protein with ATP-grasp and redox domains